MRCVCTAGSMLLLAVLVVFVVTVTGEGAPADDPSRDTSKDTSDEEKDAVFQSIKPLEAAIMPVSGTRVICSACFAIENNLVINQRQWLREKLFRAHCVLRGARRIFCMGCKARDHSSNIFLLGPMCGCHAVYQITL